MTKKSNKINLQKSRTGLVHSILNDVTVNVEQPIIVENTVQNIVEETVEDVIVEEIEKPVITEDTVELIELKPIIDLEETQNIEETVEKDVEAVIPKIEFKLQTRDYKNNSCTIETINLVPQTQHFVRNYLQPASKDAGRSAIAHLTSIVYDVTETPFTSAKLREGDKNSWIIMTDKQNFVSPKKHQNFKMLEAFGFRYDEAKREASWYKSDCDIAVLKENVEETKNIYNKIVEAMDKSHVRNSKNNQFTVTVYQKSSHLIQLNHIMREVL